jgi:hypothetical protein
MPNDANPTHKLPGDKDRDTGEVHLVRGTYRLIWTQLKYEVKSSEWDREADYISFQYHISLTKP